MLFSVLMSVYYGDKPEDVATALDSLLLQQLPPNQIVLVLDGPISEKMSETVKIYADANPIIDVIPLKTNVGLGKALGIGLTYCKYEYIARMDSDDYSLPDRFEKQIEFLEKHPDIDILGGQITEYDADMKSVLAVRNVPLNMEEITERMKTRNAMNHVTVIYKKDAVLSAGNYLHCPYFEDYYLWCRMIKNGNTFHNLSDNLVNVRTGEKMYQRRGGQTYNRAIIEFQKKIRELGFISHTQYMKNLCIRLCVANMPNSLRAYLYKTKLRAKHEEQHA